MEMHGQLKKSMASQIIYTLHLMRRELVTTSASEPLTHDQALSWLKCFHTLIAPTPL